MSVESSKPTTSGDALRQVLMDYLQTGRVVAWPGVDGFTVDDILNCYPQAIAAGAVPDWEELRRRHPELIGEIQSLLTLKGWFKTRLPPWSAQDPPDQSGR
jgi:hypothetical protein